MISEFYDEMVFVNPRPEFESLVKNMKILEVDRSVPVVSQPPVNEDPQSLNTDGNDDAPKNDYHNYFTKFDPNDHRQKLEDALQIIKMEVDRLSNEAKLVDNQIYEYVQ